MKPANNIIANLSVREKQIIAECLRAAESEAMFRDWEFETLFGVERVLLSATRAHWPDVDETNRDVRTLIANSLGHILAYPWAQNKNEEWHRYFTANPAETRALIDRLALLGL